MRVYVLHIASRSLLHRAFELVVGAPAVASCAIEPAMGRVRFTAPAGVADALVGRIYLDGAMTWCTSHDVIPVARSGTRRQIPVHGARASV